MAGYNLPLNLNFQVSPSDINRVRGQVGQGLRDIPISIDARNVARTNSAVRDLGNNLDRAGKQAEVLSEALSRQVRQAVVYNVIGGAINRVTGAISNATRESIRYQAELVKIAQVTRESNDAILSQSSALRKVSVEYNVSLKKAAELTRILTQTGLSFREASKGAEILARTSLLATFDSLTSTTEGLIAVMNTFSISVDKAAGVLESINSLSKRYAVESSDLVEAISRTGGAFQAAGGQINELLALITSVRSTTRESVETIATGFRTIFGRLQRPATIQYFKDLGIALTDLEGNFIGPFKAIQEISAGLQRLGVEAGSIEFAQAVEQIGGIRQLSKVVPLLQQATRAQDALNVANNAGQESAEDIAKAQQTLAFQIGQTQKNFQAFISEILESSSFQTFAKTLLSIANALIEIGRAVAPLIPLMTAFAGIRLGAGLIGAARASSIKGIAGFARGGMVPGSGNGDTVPAMLTPGEFVIRKSAVNAFGAENLASINKYAAGGKITKDIYDLGPKVVSGIMSSRYNKTIQKGDKIQLSAIDKTISAREVENLAKRGNTDAQTLINAQGRDWRKYLPGETTRGPLWERVASKILRKKLPTGGNPNRPLDSRDADYKYKTRAKAIISNEVASKRMRDSLKVDDGFGSDAKALGQYTSKQGEKYTHAPVTIIRPGWNIRNPKSFQRNAQKKASGGSISGTGTDTVPALLTPGEFVINKKSAQAYGYGNLKKINKYAKGGTVGPQKFALGGAVGGAVGIGLLGNIFAEADGVVGQFTSALTTTTIALTLAASTGSELVKQRQETKKSLEEEKKKIDDLNKTISTLEQEIKDAGEFDPATGAGGISGEKEAQLKAAKEERKASIDLKDAKYKERLASLKQTAVLALSAAAVAGMTAHFNLQAKAAEKQKDAAIEAGNAQDAYNASLKQAGDEAAAAGIQQYATIGAGIGALFGPVGAAIGGFIGALVGLFDPITYFTDLLGFTNSELERQNKARADAVKAIETANNEIIAKAGKRADNLLKAGKTTEAASELSTALLDLNKNIKDNIQFIKGNKQVEEGARASQEDALGKFSDQLRNIAQANPAKTFRQLIATIPNASNVIKEYSVDFKDEILLLQQGIDAASAQVRLEAQRRAALNQLLVEQARVQQVANQYIAQLGDSLSNLDKRFAGLSQATTGRRQFIGGADLADLSTANTGTKAFQNTLKSIASLSPVFAREANKLTSGLASFDQKFTENLASAASSEDISAAVEQIFKNIQTPGLSEKAREALIAQVGTDLKEGVAPTEVTKGIIEKTIGPSAQLLASVSKSEEEVIKRRIDASNQLIDAEQKLIKSKISALEAERSINQQLRALINLSPDQRFNIARRERIDISRRALSGTAFAGATGTTQELNTIAARIQSNKQLLGVMDSTDKRFSSLSNETSKLEEGLRLLTDRTAEVAAMEDKLKQSLENREALRQAGQDIAFGTRESRFNFAKTFQQALAVSRFGTGAIAERDRGNVQQFLQRFAKLPVFAGRTGEDILKQEQIRGLAMLGFNQQQIQDTMAKLEPIEQQMLNEIANQQKLDITRNTILQDIESQLAKSALGSAEFKASGGPIGGIFQPKGTDTVPAMLTPGEFVIRKSSVDKIGLANLERMNKTGTLHASNGGAVEYFNNGGLAARINEYDKFQRAYFASEGEPVPEILQKNKFKELGIRHREFGFELRALRPDEFDAVKSKLILAPNNQDIATMGSNVAEFVTSDSVVNAASTAGNTVLSVLGAIQSFNKKKREEQEKAKEFRGQIGSGFQFAGSLFSTAVGALTQAPSLLESATASAQEKYKQTQDPEFILKNDPRYQKVIDTLNNPRVQGPFRQRAMMQLAGLRQNAMRQAYFAVRKNMFKSTGGPIDNVPAMLTAGEFVMNRSAVRNIGRGTLEAMNRGGRVKGYANGGYVGGTAYLANGGESSGGIDFSAFAKGINDFSTNVQKLIDMPKVFEISLNNMGVNVNLNGAEFLATLPDLMQATIYDQILANMNVIVQNVKANLAAGN